MHKINRRGLSFVIPCHSFSFCNIYTLQVSIFGIVQKLASLVEVKQEHLIVRVVSYPLHTSKEKKNQMKIKVVKKNLFMWKWLSQTCSLNLETISSRSRYHHGILPGDR